MTDTPISHRVAATKETGQGTETETRYGINHQKNCQLKGPLFSISPLSLEKSVNIYNRVSTSMADNYTSNFSILNITGSDF